MDNETDLSLTLRSLRKEIVEAQNNISNLKEEISNLWEAIEDHKYLIHSLRRLHDE